MRPRIMRQVSCQLTGVVLTCYMDGQKIFRPLRMESLSPFENVNSGACASRQRPDDTDNRSLRGR